MTKIRLDQLLVQRELAESRSQAGNYIKLGYVKVAGEVIQKSGYFVREDAKVTVTLDERYVSRAAYKLASVAEVLKLDFRGKVVLDIGSSTGGFTDYALQHGAKKVIAVDVGTNQLHPKLRGDTRIELHEQTDFRDLRLEKEKRAAPKYASGIFCRRERSVAVKNRQVCLISEAPDIMVADVSFISLREILPHAARLATRQTRIAAMVKPQFEIGAAAKSKGVIKNDRIRRDILKDFETWAKQKFVIIDKADSDITGEKGNRERFYLLKKL